MDEEIIEGEERIGSVIDGPESADFRAFDEKELNPLLKARARNFEQRLNLLTDYQQSLLQILPDEEDEKPAVASKAGAPLLQKVIETCGDTLVFLGTLLKNSNDLPEDTPTVTKEDPIDLPFDKPFVFCYRNEGGEDESTK